MISNTVNANVHAGIRFYSSSNNEVSGNSLTNTKSGISMYGSNDNVISNNNASFNENGISLDHSGNNIIYHNNLIQNTNQASDNLGPNTWDFNYPSGGNHWSDYAGADIKSGPDQDQPGSDGIGDTPHPIPGGSSVDRYPLVAPYTSPTGPQNKSLAQVEGQPEVYWFQNNMLYWVMDWNVINDMSGVPGWDSVNTLPASEFDPATYPQGPRFITTGAESNDLLIREQGDIKVYLILNGEKRHFTSPEALTWNGHGFDDVIEVSSTIVGMFPEGTPISIQEKHLLRKPGGTHVFWSQNGKLYYVTADALDKMLDIHDWDWDEINEPADFNPEDPSHYKTFITTDPESNGVLIRLWDGYKVYRIEDGFRRHITYPDVMELKGYAMEDVIDVSQEIIDMFLLGDPIGIEVNLTFNKTTDAGEETCTKFTTGETVRFYTETTVSESYTVDTYVKLIEPDGRTRYAYYTDPDFHPTDQLSFSDTEVPLYPGHWDAVSKDWNWHEYVFDNDAEGVYTWEFYYRDVISGKVLGWDRKSYVFAKKTALGLELTISTNKEVYRENEPIIIFADVHDLNGNDVVVNKNDFEVYLDNFPQEFELEQVCSIHGNYEIIGLKLWRHYGVGKIKFGKPVFD
jgi:parallel beta-helix repeat protein